MNRTTTVINYIEEDFFKYIRYSVELHNNDDGSVQSKNDKMVVR